VAALRARDVLVLLLLLALPGCAAPTPVTSPEGSVGETLHGIIPHAAEVVLVGAGGEGEAHLATSPSGVLLACGNGGMKGPSPTWISRDGRNWTSVSILGVPPASGCDVAAGPQGSLYVAYASAGGIVVAVSRDGGASWVVATASRVGAPVRDHPRLLATRDALLVTSESVSGPYALFASRSQDGGQTWTEDTLVAPTILATGRAGGPVEASGSVAVAVRLDGASPGLRLHVLSGLGIWNEKPIDLPGAAVAGFVPEIAGDAQGRLSLPVPVRRDNGTDVLLLQSDDLGASWSPAIVPAFQNVTLGSPPALAVDARQDGGLTVAVQNESIQKTWVVSVARYDPGGSFVAGGPVGDPPAPPGGAVGSLSVRHDAQGLARIAYPAREFGCGGATLPGDAGYCVYLLSERMVVRRPS